MSHVIVPSAQYPMQPCVGCRKYSRNLPQFRTEIGMRKRQQSLVLPWKNCHVAQAESCLTSPGFGRELSLRDNHTGACVPQRFIYKKRQISRNCSLETGQNWSGTAYLNAVGWHLRRFVVYGKSVPSGRQRMVTDQILYCCVLKFSRVKIDATICIPQGPVSAGIALWSWKNQGHHQTKACFPELQPFIFIKELKTTFRQRQRSLLRRQRRRRSKTMSLQWLENVT